MGGVLAAPGAELAQLEPLGRLLPVLRVFRDLRGTALFYTGRMFTFAWKKFSGS